MMISIAIVVDIDRVVEVTTILISTIGTSITSIVIVVFVVVAAIIAIYILVFLCPAGINVRSGIQSLETVVQTSDLNDNR
jgi:cell division protein FtsL